MNPFARFALDAAAVGVDTDKAAQGQGGNAAEAKSAAGGRKRQASDSEGGGQPGGQAAASSIELGSPQHAREVIGILRDVPELQLASVHRFQAFFKELMAGAAPGNPAFCCLIASILSAQTRDDTAIAAAKRVVQHFEGDVTPAKVAAMPLEELEGLVRTCNYYRTKAKAIHRAARMLQDIHDGEVPDDWDALLRLPGVGPKIANLVLCVSHGVYHGLVVDTHVRRLTQRIGIASSAEDLEQAFDAAEWNDVTVTLISFGQTICLPVRSKCAECPLAGKQLCKFDIEHNSRRRQTVLLAPNEEGEEGGRSPSRRPHGDGSKKPKPVAVEYEESSSLR